MRGEPDSVARLALDQFRSAEYRAFAHQLFGEKHLDERFRYWEWLYVENPAVKHGAPLPVFVYYDPAGNAAGQMGTVPFEFGAKGGNILNSAWCIDFYVLPQHQRKGLGRRLLAAGEQSYAFFATIGQTDVAYNLFVKSGWVQGPSLTTYKRLAPRPRSVLKMVLRKFGLPSSAAPRPAGRKRDPAGARVHGAGPVESFTGEEVGSAASWFESMGRGGVHRSAAYLEWRYVRHPLIAYERARVGPDGGPTILVYHVDSAGAWREFHLVDVLVAPSSSDGRFEMRAAVDAVIKLAREEDCDLVRCDATVPELLDGLPSGYFSRKEPGARFLYRVAPETNFDPPGEWHLFGGDCDLDALAWNS